MKLRTALTAFGVTVGIGALVAMVGFGKGLQKNVSESFEKLDLLNSITVFPGGALSRNPFRDPDEQARNEPKGGGKARILDDEAIKKFERMPGVEIVFPEIRFPAMVKLGDSEEFRLVQVLPSKIAASKLVKLAAGKPFARDDEDAVIIGRTLLSQMNVKDPASALGRKLRISSLAFDFGALVSGNIGAIIQGGRLPFKKQDYEFTVIGVTESMGFSGPTPLQSDIYIPPGSAQRIEKLPFTNIWDLFRAREGALGYSAVNIRLASPAHADSVKRQIQDMGFSTFALIDQFSQVKTSFVFMDMVLAAVGMIAIFVAALGIVNTMVMSILERKREIGVLKSLGADDSDIRFLFLVESGVIGAIGAGAGIFFGWLITRVASGVAHIVMQREGIPPMELFALPLWLILIALAIGIGVSLLAGAYPAGRAARVDPVEALRND